LLKKGQHRAGTQAKGWEKKRNGLNNARGRDNSTAKLVDLAILSPNGGKGGSDIKKRGAHNRPRVVDLDGKAFCPKVKGTIQRVVVTNQWEREQLETQPAVGDGFSQTDTSVAG